MGKRLDDAMRAMDGQRVDADGRIRLGGTQSRAEAAFLTSLFSGAFGVAVFVVCCAALFALVVWLFL